MAVIAIAVFLQLPSPVLVLLLFVVYLKFDQVLDVLEDIGFSHTDSIRRFRNGGGSQSSDKSPVDPDDTAGSDPALFDQPLNRAFVDSNMPSGTDGKSITQLDDALIAAGAIAGLVAAGILLAKVSASDPINGSLQILLVGTVTASAVLLGLGFHVRGREKTSLRLLQLIQYSPETRISTLLRQSRFNITSLRRSVSAINSAGIGHLVLDEPNDRLYDGRMTARFTVRHECSSCGAATEMTFDVQQEQNLVCGYCHNPLPVDAVNSIRAQQRQSVLIQNHSAKARVVNQRIHESGANPPPRLSLATLLLLLVFFPPGALFYFARHYLSHNARTARLHALVAEQSAAMRRMNMPRKETPGLAE
ncbi:MAG: hypothetical protein HKN42_17510 [Granulosicoccus sp.]|nr:hypothetical protein [Granulosicoccus sp.]